MIQIVSLLLGLVLGPQEVEWTIGPEVATVEIRLDGELVAQLGRDQRRLTVDFGGEVEPHRLEAVARDADGRELGRATRVVNYAHTNHGASIALDPPAAEGSRRGRVIWRAVLEQAPEELTLEFDGQPLETAPDGAFVLPAHDPAKFHYLEAEVVFADGATVRSEMSFGGAFGEQTTSALTAVPVRSPPGAPWTPEAAQGWLLAAGRPARVFTTHAGPARLLLLRDRSFVATVRRLRRHPVAQRLLNAATAEAEIVVDHVDARPLKRHEGTFRVDRVNADRKGALPGLFLAAEALVGGHRVAGRQRLGDALAVAGARAASSNARRAVVLLLGHPGRDDSRLTLAQAAHYLESVRVPLLVWAPSEEALRGIGPPARAYLGPDGLAELVDRVGAEFATQTVVWLEGEYLPAEVELSARAPGGVEMVR